MCLQMRFMDSFAWFHRYTELVAHDTDALKFCLQGSTFTNVLDCLDLVQEFDFILMKFARY